MHGRDLRYCYGFRRWLVWDGRRWLVDPGGRAEKLAKETAIEFLRQAADFDNQAAVKFAKQTLDQRRINAMLQSAQCELPIGVDELDTDRDLLNVMNGTVDLRTGELRPHRRGDLITKLVPFAYKPEAECPVFLRFLDRVMGGGPDASQGDLERAERRIDWLQKALGYSLTGWTTEKAVFLALGPGNNGKTTLLSTFLRLLADYAVLLQIDTLMVRQESNNTQADLADLRGARFVMTSETEDGQRLAEGKLKRITQGMGRIKAVRKYENPITFEETHKLWIDANHRPLVRGTDQAIWNRLYPIPFEVTIPPEEVDRSLPDKLLAEAEGILAWAVAGAVRWRREGLGRPDDVQAANEQWRREMDQLGRFIEECCVVGEFAQARAREVYQAYRRWAEECGEHTVGERRFAGWMAERGFTKRRTAQGNVYSGIGLAVVT